MSNDNITPIATKPDDIKASVERLTRHMPDMIEHAKLIAKIRRIEYVAMVSEGFTPGEALAIIIGKSL